MGYVIIRPARDVDEYVIWCTGTERPIAVGDRVEIARDAAEIEPDRADLPARLDHTDLHGSSMVPSSFGWWDDDAFIYAQRGLLRRSRLAAAARLLLIEDNEEAVRDLLEPFADDPAGPGAR